MTRLAVTTTITLVAAALLATAGSAHKPHRTPSCARRARQRQHRSGLKSYPASGLRRGSTWVQRRRNCDAQVERQPQSAKVSASLRFVGGLHAGQERRSLRPDRNADQPRGRPQDDRSAGTPPDQAEDEHQHVARARHADVHLGELRQDHVERPEGDVQRDVRRVRRRRGQEGDRDGLVHLPPDREDRALTSGRYLTAGDPRRSSASCVSALRSSPRPAKGASRERR